MSKAHEALKRLLERAESRIVEEGMTHEDPLSIEVNGRYVNIVFTTGGPHIEVQLDFGYEGGGDYWFEEAPERGRLEHVEWFQEPEVAYFGSEDAWLIQSGILRDPDDLVELTDTCQHCGAEIGEDQHRDWIDATDGDACPEAVMHEPTEEPSDDDPLLTDGGRE